MNCFKDDSNLLDIDFSTWLCFKAWQKKDIFRHVFGTSRTLTKKARGSIKERKKKDADENTSEW